jgi:hypothetical protein
VRPKRAPCAADNRDVPPVTFYVSDDEYTLMRERAADAGQALRAYVRSALMLDRGPDAMTAELADHEERIARLEELVIAVGLGA